MVNERKNYSEYHERIIHRKIRFKLSHFSPVGYDFDILRRTVNGIELLLLEDGLDIERVVEDFRDHWGLVLKIFGINHSKEAVNFVLTDNRLNISLNGCKNKNLQNIFRIYTGVLQKEAQKY